MPEGFSILAELTSAVIGAITGMLAEHGKNSVMQKIEEKALIRKIRNKEKYLRGKYEKSFEPLKKLDKGSFYEWLKEKGTISRILSFSNAEDTGNLNIEQMRHSKEVFFTDAFHMAQARDFCEKEELRKVLNDIFLYVDELFWKILDEKDVFLYKKCVLEIRQLIREFTEEIIREIQYHGSFAEYIDNQKVGQKVQFKLDYRSEEIPFVGRTAEFGEIDAFCASEKQISWWAVIGKGGSGKSRLVYEYIKRNIGSAEWKMCFLREEFFSQAGGGGKYKTWNTWTYDKNLLLVVDYVQKYAKEVAQWIEGLSVNNSITRKIRILLLERTDGEQSLWMKEGFEKQVVGDLKYDKDFLMLQSLDVDLIPFGVKYAEKNGRQLDKADAKDAWDKLKSIDADTRILYFIMILEAIFDNAAWRNWNRNDLAGYIVRREQEDIAVRFKHDKDMIRSFNRVLAFCTATRELPVFEMPENLPEMIKKEIEVIKNNSGDKHELCAGMQLENGVLQPVTPDIIGEYMVLYIIDQYFFDKGEKEEFIKELWDYDSGDFHIFVFHLFQDKMDNGAYEDITKLMLFDAVPYGDIWAMRYYSDLLWGMTAISDLNQAIVCVEKLKKIYHDYSFDEIIAYCYAKGLLNLSHKQEGPEQKEMVEELARLSEANEGNGDIKATYAEGLAYLSCRQGDEQGETARELARLAKANEGNEDIQAVYAIGLFDLSSKQNDAPEIKETVAELARLFEENKGNRDILIAYAGGLLNLSKKQEGAEQKETVRELARLSEVNEGNANVQTKYAVGLFNLSRKQERPEQKETLKKLARLSEANEGNEDIQTAYAKGLLHLSCKQEDVEEQRETVRELARLAKVKEGNEDIQALYVESLRNLRIEWEEIKKMVHELARLSKANKGNRYIQGAYAEGLFTLGGNHDDEQKETLRELARLSKENEGDGYIQAFYAKGLYLSIKQEDEEERKEAVGELARLAAVNRENAVIQEIYTEAMDILGSE